MTVGRRLNIATQGFRGTIGGSTVIDFGTIQMTADENPDIIVEPDVVITVETEPVLTAEEEAIIEAEDE